MNAKGDILSRGQSDVDTQASRPVHQGLTDPVDRVEEIFQEYGGFIRKILQFYCWRGMDADDMFQEFFLRLVRVPIPPCVTNIRAYLYQSIRYFSIELARRRASELRMLHAYRADMETSNARSAKDVGIAGDIASKIDRGFCGLSRREAEAMILKYRHNCDLDEVAATMGVNRRTVKAYTMIGLRKLRGRLAALRVAPR